MREIDMLKDLPQATDRPAIKRTIQNKIVASYQDDRYYYGDRADGYGGYKNDGRWKPVAKYMVDFYGLTPQDRVVQYNAEKQYLLDEFRALGIESFAAWDAFPKNTKLIIAIGAPYIVPLGSCIEILKRIAAHNCHSFITLGSFDTPEDERIFRDWSLLGCTILSKPDWLEVLKHCGYTGDYKFVTARTLGLV